MVVHTNSQKARVARKTNVEFLLSQHDSECTSCTRSGNCSLQSLANDLGITDLPFPKHLEGFRSDPTFPLIRNNDKCIKCLRCIQICEKVQATGVWDLTSRASHTVVNVAGGKKLSETDCALCGQCITHCPTGALRARDDTERVFDALGDPDKICLVQVAPAVRTSWGESLGLAHEDATVKRLASALRMMGFDYVFDTNFSADLTIMEEGSELLERIKKAGEPGGENIKFPMFTSCCPGLDSLRQVALPRYARPGVHLQVAAADVRRCGKDLLRRRARRGPVEDQERVHHAVCGQEVRSRAAHDGGGENGDPDVDVVLTVREVDRMIRASHIDATTLPEQELDQPLGVGTGAAVIFGATGGVMDAALRSAYFLATGENPDPDAFSGVRGLDGWKEKTFDLAGTPLRVAVAHGLGNAHKLIEALRAGEVEYDFVEIMACPGGCVGWRRVSPSTTAASSPASAATCCGVSTPRRRSASATRTPA